MLDEVAPTGTTMSDVVDDVLGGAQLVVAGENQPALVALGGGLPQGVVAQDAQEQLWFEDLLPQVRGVGTVRVDGVAGMPVVALVEGEEEGCQPVQLGGHPGFLVGYREVHQSPTRLEEWAVLVRLAVDLVLLDRIAHSLGVVGFELQGGDRDAVDGEHQIQGVGTGGIERDLAQHAQTVVGSVLDRTGVQGVFRVEGDHGSEGGLHLAPLGVRETVA